MIVRRFECNVESLEPRALLSHAGLTSVTDARGGRHGPALVGSVQGTETATVNEFQFTGTGTVQPLGDVSVSGFLLYGGPHGSTGAVNGRGSLTLSNGQGTLTLAMKSHGYFRVPHQMGLEEIRVTVQVQSATGSYAGIHVQGTTNLVNPIVLIHSGAVNPHVPFSASINLKPSR
jgi:hypothetical protein